MNKLVMTMTAAMAFAAFAQEPAAPAEGEGAPKPAAMRDQGPRRMGGDRPFGPMMGGEMMGGDPVVRAVMNPRAAEKLGLSEEQKAKVAALRNSDKETVKALQEKVREGMKRQLDLLKAEKVDEAAVMKAIDDVFEARKEMAKAQTKRMISVKAVLTPEQITKALETMKEMRGPKGEGRGPRGPRAKGPAANAK